MVHKAVSLSSLVLFYLPPMALEKSAGTVHVQIRCVFQALRI